MRLVDRTGDRYGRLVVVAQAPNRGGSTRWLCRCDCGEMTDVRTNALSTGHTRSCGCVRPGAPYGKHGLAKTATYRSWASMKQRCFNPNTHNFENWGGRGITVCKKWAESFESFYADMGERPPGTSLDRIDVDGDYEPGNCRWATAAEQANNKRARTLQKKA